MPSTTPLTDAINALTQYANETTGQSDTNLSDAVGTLVAGYGGGGGSVLPDGYTQLEYIESTGTQYIDTGLYTKAGQTYYIDCVRPGGIGSTTNFMGNNLATGCGMFLQNGQGGGDLWFRFGTANYQSANDGDKISARQIKIDSTGMYKYNPVSKAYELLVANPTTSVVEDSSIHNILFGRTTGTSTRQLDSVMIFYFKCEENGVAVRDMYPAIRNLDGVLGMYDIVNDVFYTNAGTGTFNGGIAA